MTSTQNGSINSREISEKYRRDGFFFPIDVADSGEARDIRADLEAAEAELAEDPERLALLRSYPDRVLPSFDRLIRNDTVIAAVSAILGPDLMVWRGSLFIKEANSPNIVSWHQDLTYWGLDDAEEATCWIALSPSTSASGCMNFVPGSHKNQLVPHIDTFDENNLLTRGQEIAVEVNEEDGVAAELQTGQASIHHGHLFHASGPNGTNDRRIGFAIRFIKPSMKQRSGDHSLVALVSGEDRYGHFTLVESPKGRLEEEDFDLCRRDAEIKRRILYEGAEVDGGKRYRV